MKKTLYLLRHAKAINRLKFKGPDDSLRPLTSGGVKKFESTLKKIKKKKVKIKHSYHSPFLRCKQTAHLLEKEFNIKSKPLSRLAHGSNVRHLLTLLRKLKNHTVLIGHEPELSDLYLLLGLKGPLFKKGEFRCIQVKVPKDKKTPVAYKELWTKNSPHL
ncbi:MAG: histidine phosphatase family protein [Bdellovibrionota bacterium]